MIGLQNNLVTIQFLVIVSLSMSCHGFWWPASSQPEPPPAVKQVPVGYFRTYTYHPLAVQTHPVATYQTSFQQMTGQHARPISGAPQPQQQLPPQQQQQQQQLSSAGGWQTKLLPGTGGPAPVHPGVNQYLAAATYQAAMATAAASNGPQQPQQPPQSQQPQQPQQPQQQQLPDSGAQSSTTIQMAVAPSSQHVNEMRPSSIFATNPQKPSHHSAFPPDPVNLQYVTNVAAPQSAAMNVQHVQFVPCMCPVTLTYSSMAAAAAVGGELGPVDKRSDEVVIEPLQEVLPEASQI